jgi:predicted nucleic acid-binding Zn ribbon protein
MSDTASSIHNKIRLLSWRLRSILIRQAARRMFDLTHLGQGPLERLCSSLILGCLFLLVTLLLFLLIRLPTLYGVALAIVALVTVQVTSAVLILWPADNALEQERVQVRGELQELRRQAAIRRQAFLQQEAIRQQEAAAALDQGTDRPQENTPILTPDMIAAVPPLQARRPVLVAHVVNKGLETELCPYCGEVIQADVLKCKHCGELLDRDLARRRNTNYGLAAVLSFLIPGLGQLYKSQILGGLLWWVAVSVGYFLCIIPGFFLHVVCIFDAASDNG